MRVLVVGGAGYLGGEVVNALRVHQVTVYDALLYTPEYLKPVQFVRGDVRDTDKLAPWLKWADAVIWLAAIVGDAACMVNPQVAVDTNLKAVEWLAANYKGKIIFTSSCSVYGIADGVADETSALAPQSLYAETKIKAEAALMEAGANALMFRLGTLHGIAERLRFDLVVNVLAMRAASTGKIEVFGGKQYRPLLAVQDAAAHIVKMLSGDYPVGIYNLASENLTIAEVAERVAAQVEGVEVRKVASQYEDKRNYRVSSDKARAALGFSPYLTVDDSIRDIAAAIRAGRVRDTGALHYSNLTALEGSK